MPTTNAVRSAPSLGTSTLSVAEAKAHLSAVLNHVQKERSPITIVRRGVPVAQIVPFPQTEEWALSGCMAGRGRELGDIVGPTGEIWDADEE